MKKQSYTLLNLAVATAMVLALSLSASAQSSSAESHTSPIRPKHINPVSPRPDLVVSTPLYQNPAQLAIKSWWPANQSAVVTLHPPSTSLKYLASLSSPGGLVFDGSHIWAEHVVSTGDYVDKIQASDNAYEGSFLVGDVAVPSAYDGVNVIAPDHNPSLNPGRVYFVRAADGNIAACSLGGGVTYPDTAAFDGQNVWVSTDTGYVVALSFNQTSRTCGPPICTTYLGSRLYDLISDGNGSIWVTAVDNNAVYQLSSGCGVVGVVTGIPGPIGIVYDGTYLWTANDFGYSISQIAPGAGGGTVVSTTALSFSPWWIAFDGENIWTTGPSAGQVSVMSTSSPFSTLNYYQTCGSATSVPLELAFDGANMWVGCEGVNLLGKM